MTIPDFLRDAAYLRQSIATIRPHCRIDALPTARELSDLVALDASVEINDSTLADPLLQAGVRDIFLNCTAQSDEALITAFGKCRYIVRNKTELQQLNRVVLPLLPTGHLENIAIRLISDGNADEDFTPQNIAQFGRWVRFSDALAVRGIFLELSDAAHPAEAAKEGFSLVKKIRADLPCLFHSFCFSGLLARSAHGDAELTRTLKMLASLNDTSLYADFLLE